MNNRDARMYVYVGVALMLRNYCISTISWLADQ